MYGSYLVQPLVSSRTYLAYKEAWAWHDGRRALCTIPDRQSRNGRRRSVGVKVRSNKEKTECVIV